MTRVTQFRRRDKVHPNIGMKYFYDISTVDFRGKRENRTYVKSVSFPHSLREHSALQCEEGVKGATTSEDVLLKVAVLTVPRGSH